MGRLSIDSRHDRDQRGAGRAGSRRGCAAPTRVRRSRVASCAPGSTSRWPGRSPTWVTDNHLSPGDRLPPERELAARLGVSRATLSQALVALEVIGAVSVRHGDGTVVTRVGAGLAPGGDEVGDAGTRRTVEAIRAHADRLPEIIDTRDALETKLAALAAERRTEGDLARIDAALRAMADDIEAGGRGVEGDELFHAAVTAAAHSLLLARLMEEISDLIKETRLESLASARAPARLAGRPPGGGRRDPRPGPGRRGRRDARPRRDGQRRGAAAARRRPSPTGPPTPA